MKVNRLAIPIGVFLFSLTVVSAGQSNDEPKPFAPHMQAASQAANTGAPDTTSQLTAEQMADLMMARKEFREAAVAYKKLTEQYPTSAPIYNKLGIALHKG